MFLSPAHILRTTVVAAITAGAVASAVQAMDRTALEAEFSLLSSDQQSDLMRGATALCLAYPTDRKKIVAILQQAGWSVGGDTQWIEADRQDSWVTLLGEDTDFDCDVQGDVPQSETEKMIWSLFEATKYADWEITESDRSCRLFSHPRGALIYVASSGNDPTCEPHPTSRISVAGERN